MAGNRPLQGTKLLVKDATSRSRGESIIRQPVTPTALQPNPMHMVRACLPQAPAFWKQWSRVKATRGRYPKSSSRVNKGKNTAMGGSITDTTQDSTRQTPMTSSCSSHTGAPMANRPALIASPNRENPSHSHWDGMLAPAMVIQNTPANNSSITGIPVHLPVRI